MTPRRKWLTAALFGSGAAWAVLILGLNAAGKVQRLGQADCLIVPGARSYADGTCGPTLTARVERAVELYHQGWAGPLICTGGLGADGSIEAICARNLAMRLGVPDSAIYTEESSHTTWENLSNARDIMAIQGWSSCLIVTDPFHEPRCLWMCRELGLTPLAAPTLTGPASLHWTDWLFYNTRELAGIARYAVSWGWRRCNEARWPPDSGSGTHLWGAWLYPTNRGKARPNKAWLGLPRR